MRWPPAVAGPLITLMALAAGSTVPPLDRPGHLASAPVFDRYPAVPAKVVRVIDGDTVILDAILPYNVSRMVRIRVDGFDAPEPGEPGGHAATEELARLLDSGEVWVKSDGRRSFERWRGDVWVISDNGRVTSVAEHMIENGHDKDE